MKQTAVEYLIQEIELGLSEKGMKNVFQHAKAMEREQMLEFWQGGINCSEEGGESFDQYYNQTYGGE